MTDKALRRHVTCAPVRFRLPSITHSGQAWSPDTRLSASTMMVAMMPLPSGR